MNLQIEMAHEPWLFEAGLDLSFQLDQRFAITRNFRVLSQRDVPGLIFALFLFVLVTYWYKQLAAIVICLWHDYGFSYKNAAGWSWLFTRSAKLLEGLYILPMFFILFYFFLNFFSGRPRSPAGSEANGPIFTKISGLVDRWKGLITLLSFFDFPRDVAMATN